jgi:GDPmannose 4,6-dehydratase
MKKALICGISGQDGAYLASLLLKNGYSVYGTSRDAATTNFDNLRKIGILNNVILISTALNDFRNVLHVVKNVQPDEIYNLSGQSSVGLSFEQPIETIESITLATLNILEAIRLLERRIKFYNAASSECFGDTFGKPANEQTAFRPRSPYAIAKAAAYWEVANYREAYGLFACSGILFNHESPFRHERFVTKKIILGAARIAAGHQNKLVLGNLEIARDWGWAPEYVNAMWRMLQSSAPQDYVIATGKTYCLREFVELAFLEFDLEWSDFVEVDLLNARPTEIMVSRGDPSRAMKDLNWMPSYDMPRVVKEMTIALRNGTWGE